MSQQVQNLQDFRQVQLGEFRPSCMIVFKDFIICGSREGQLLRINDSNANYETFETKLGSVECLLSISDNEFVASGLKEIQIFTFQNTKLNHISTFEGHDDCIIGLGKFENWLYSASEDTSVMKWNLKTKEFKRLYQHDSPIICFDVEKKTGNTVSCCTDLLIKIFDSKLDKTENISIDSKIWAVKFLPHENGIICGDHEGSVFIIKNTIKVLTSSIHESRVKSISISETGKNIVTASFDQKVKVLDQQLKVKFIGDNHQDWIRTVLFKSNNEIVSTGDDQKVIFWKLPENPPKSKKKCSRCLIL